MSRQKIAIIGAGPLPSQVKVKWTKKEVCLVIDCLRYAQRALKQHPHQVEKENMIDALCERINCGNTVTTI